MADAIVLAVYIPAQLPGPGIAVRSISFISRAEIAPLANAPRASKTEMTSRRFAPGRIVPPYTNTEGRSSRASAIRQPGMFLSQPPMATTPSKPCAPETVSIESAITSRDTSE